MYLNMLVERRLNLRSMTVILERGEPYSPSIRISEGRDVSAPVLRWERTMTNPTELHPEHNVLIRKLRSISPLSEDERHCLLTLPLSTKGLAADQDIVREGDRPSECCLV